MGTKKQWSVLRVIQDRQHGRGECFAHGRSNITDVVYAAELKPEVSVLVVRDGKTIDKGSVALLSWHNHRLRFVGLESTVPSGYRKNAEPPISVSFADSLRASWFQEGDVIRLGISSSALRIALDRPF